MPTTTFTCTYIKGFTTVWKDWSYSNGAYQGQLSGKDCGGEIGFNFSALGPRSNIAISAIKLTFHAGDKGGSYKKYLNLRIGGFNGSSATKVGAFGFSQLYNTTKSINFSASSNAAGFNTLKNYILGGGNTLNYDYMNVTSMSLEITYTYLKSTGSIETAQTGSDATLAITAYNSTYSHVVTWRMGGNSHSQSVAAGAASASYTIPHSWLPDAETGTATVELETLDGNGDSLGSNVYSFALSVPASVVPSIGSLTVAPVNAGASSAAAAWGLYIQGKTRAAAAIGNASAGSGATIAGYAISTSPSFGSAALSSLTTELLTAAGTVTITATVTDSRGRTATATATITVQAYAAPVFTATPAAYRCGQDGTRNDTGGVYAKLTAAFGCSSILDGSTEKNSFTVAKVTLNGVDTNLTSGVPAIIGAGALSVGEVRAARAQGRAQHRHLPSGRHDRRRHAARGRRHRHGQPDQSDEHSLPGRRDLYQRQQRQPRHVPGRHVGVFRQRQDAGGRGCGRHGLRYGREDWRRKGARAVCRRAAESYPRIGEPDRHHAIRDV